MASWGELNRSFLVTELERVGRLLDGQEAAPSPWHEPREPALAHVQRAFRLSPFERDVVVMCAGFALDPAFAAKLGGRPTFSHAIAKLAHSHFDASAPTSPLRAFRLVTQQGDSPQDALALDERILHFLLGTIGVDERLLPYMLAGTIKPASLTETQHQLAARIARAIRATQSATVMQLFGGHALTRFAIVQDAATQLGLGVLRLRAPALALPIQELATVQQLVEREMLLTGLVPFVEVDGFDGNDAARAARSFAAGISGITVVSAAEPMPVTHTSSVLFEMPQLAANERRAVWISALGDNADRIAPKLDRLATQFRLEASEIEDVCRFAQSEPAAALADELWRQCLERSRPRIEDLARRIKPTATWDDLVVPPSVIATLREVVAQLRFRHAVHEQWGFARGDARGQAITALFAGPSGTGKTLAAEVIAHETALDLYHVDLSQVVDKYVGETEKRLRRIFDAAEAGGAILLFDEADALFGKRAQVERGTDRWANIEVSYLLQRMESYNGLAILTTNAKDALDAAFLRRLRFVVQFPFPDVRLRAELWRRVIPADAPREALDIGKLARLQLTGANIKGVAINAAFHAASEQTPLTMQHLVRAARSEFAKLELPFPEADVRTWELTGRR